VRGGGKTYPLRSFGLPQRSKKLFEIDNDRIPPQTVLLVFPNKQVRLYPRILRVKYQEEGKGQPRRLAAEFGAPLSTCERETVNPFFPTHTRKQQHNARIHPSTNIMNGGDAACTKEERRAAILHYRRARRGGMSLEERLQCCSNIGVRYRMPGPNKAGNSEEVEKRSCTERPH